MRIALAQLNYIIGDFAGNKKKIIDTVKKCEAHHADVVVFSELAICGYPPQDFLEFEDFINQCHQSLTDIASHCKHCSVIIGAPSKNTDKKGKNLFNSAWLLADGKATTVAHKSLLPNYDIFDEYRYFESGKNFHCIELNGKRLAITICEDIWDISTDDPLYFTPPMDVLSKQNPDIMINLSASPFNYEQANMRRKVLKDNALRYDVPVVYVNQVGAQTEILFDGNSCVVNANGEVLLQCKSFEEDVCFFEFDENISKLPSIQGTQLSQMQLIHDALVMGIKDYFAKMGFTKAVLGLSGGIDSAITAALAVEALGKENVYGVLLPSEYSTSHSVKDAEDLANNLGCKYDIISIKDAYVSILNSVQPFFNGLPFNVAEENIQARARGIILMALSNKLGYILLNTTNKSEAAVGYGTLYGDMCGGIAVLADVYKTQIYKLADYINREREIIPQNTINKPPSAELRPGQKDSDSLPDYAVLDAILYQYVELRKSPHDIIEKGFDQTTVRRVLKMVNSNEWKRYQFAPILRVSSKSFGLGRRMPIVGKYLS